MSEHDEDAVVERVAADHFSEWDDMDEIERRSCKGHVREFLHNLKPGDRLPGVDESGQPTTLMVVPTDPTCEMLMEGQRQVNLSEKEGAYEVLSRAEIEAIYAAMLAASGDTDDDTGAEGNG